MLRTPVSGAYDDIERLAWELGRAYCPRPEDEPCAICVDDALAELEKVHAQTHVLSPEVIDGLKRRLADGTVDVLDIAVTVDEEANSRG